MQDATFHSLQRDGELIPVAFTFPFRYTPHPLALKAAHLVQEHLQRYTLKEGKMFGVLVVEKETGELGFLAAYSGQFAEAATDPYFVPLVYDYLAPDNYFQQEQCEIVALTKRIEATSHQTSSSLAQLQHAIEHAQQRYREGKERRDKERASGIVNEAQIRESQFQKAEITRAKRLYAKELQRVKQHQQVVQQLLDERKLRSEALQQWLFEQTILLNGRHEQRSITEIFAGSMIPSGAGECCAPKLLHAAYLHHLRPICMAEFWWGVPSPELDRLPGEFYPSCHRKCGPILAFMLQGFDVEPDPAEHYEQSDVQLQVVWEDEHLAVVAKPAGMLSVPGKADLPNVFDEALKRWSHLEEPAIVHRLDLDTSGLMLIAKTRQTYHRLQRDFAERKIHKRYIAILEGTPAHTQGEISLPLAPDYNDLPRQHVSAEGLEAITRYEVLDATRVAFYPLTGRTHQLRVHAASPQGLGIPILGDRLYGHVAARLYLHAETLSFTHPVTREEMTFTLPAPF